MSKFAFLGNVSKGKRESGREGGRELEGWLEGGMAGGPVSKHTSRV